MSANERLRVAFESHLNEPVTVRNGVLINDDSYPLLTFTATAADGTEYIVLADCEIDIDEAIATCEEAAACGDYDEPWW